jgi:hypothetical protein
MDKFSLYNKLTLIQTIAFKLPNNSPIKFRLTASLKLTETITPIYSPLHVHIDFMIEIA